MFPLIPILGWAIGGIFGAAAIAVACDDDDYDSYEATDDSAEREAAREKDRRKREEKERRKMASLEEAKGNLSRANGRHQRRIASAKSTAARSKAHLDELVAVERDVNNLLK